MARVTTRKAAKKTPARRATAKPAKNTAKRYSATPADKSDKEHLITVIRDTTGCSAAAAKQTLDGLIGTVTASLKKNQKVQLTGFGSFTVTKRPARAGRNPRTGEKIRIRASKSVRFKPGKTLKQAV
jgi:DNA-binding protein HU-beta